MKEKTNPERGTYVSRAVYAKLQAENKRLIKDIYTMVMGISWSSIETRKKWKDKFEKDKELNRLLKELLIKKDI